MGQVQDQFAEAFRETRDAFGVPITVAGQAVTAVVAESPMSRELTAGGFQESASFIARVLAADLTTAPKLGDAVEYKGALFKVQRVAEQPGHPVLELTLTAARR